MKNLVFLLGLFSLLVFTGCKNGDDSVDSIVGTWYMNSISVDGTLKNGTNTTPMKQTQQADACAQRTQFIFNADGSGSATSYQNSNGNCVNLGSESFTYKYNASSKTIAITSGGQTENLNLSSVSATELSFGQTFNNIDFGTYEPQLSGYFFTGTISTTFKKK